MTPVVHPGRFLKLELKARSMSANQLALAVGVPSGQITDIINEKRGITADTATRLGRFFGVPPRFWVDFQSEYELAVVARDKGAEIARRVRPADEAA